MPSTTPPLGNVSVGPRPSGSSMPAIRPGKHVQAPLYSGPSPTFGRPNILAGTCFSPARIVPLVPSSIRLNRVLLVQLVRTSVCGEVVLTVGNDVPMIIAPLLSRLNQFSALGLFGLPRMSPT